MKVLLAVTQHGFGHATRQMAVARALRARDPDVEVTFWSAVPDTVFHGYLGPPTWYAVERVAMDVGVVQHDSVRHDLDATLARLEALWSGAGPVPDLVERLARARFDRILADIPPPLMVAARRSGTPAWAAGNFDWAFIYGAYAELDARFAPWRDRCLEGHAAARGALWMEPGPAPVGFATVHLVGIVGRRAEPGADGWRARVAAPGERLVLLSFGGFGLDGLAERIPRLPGVRWVTSPPVAALVGRDDCVEVRDVPFPALVAGVDVVLSKPGYGMIAECVANRARFLYLERDGFPETPHLVRWVDEHLPSGVVERLDAPTVAAALERVLALPARWPDAVDGADRVAERLLA